MPVSFSKGEDWFCHYLPENTGEPYDLQTVEVSFFLKKIRETVYLEGQLNTTVSLPCSRCLETTSLQVKCHFNYIFSPSGGPYVEEQELSAEDVDTLYYEEETIDLDPIVYEQIVMNIPVKALCRDSCKGLCSVCGINLNEASCQCRAQSVDPRFDILKKLKI